MYVDSSLYSSWYDRGPSRQLTKRTRCEFSFSSFFFPRVVKITRCLKTRLRLLTPQQGKSSLFCSMPGYAISPTLVTLLKFLDGHLSLSAHATSPSSLALVPFLVRQLDHLADSLIDDSSAQARGRDAADAGTFQGVVLVLHCLCSIGLALEQEEEVASYVLPDQLEASEKMVEGIESVVRESFF